MHGVVGEGGREVGGGKFHMLPLIMFVEMCGPEEGLLVLASITHLFLSLFRGSLLLGS